MSLPWKHRIGGAEPAALSAARRGLEHVLRLCGFSDDESQVAVIILGELLANACEHGRPPVDITLTAKERSLELTVEDGGSGVTRRVNPDPLSLRGRGFAIIERLGGRIELRGEPHSSVKVRLPF